jgi:hypothetical protein
MLAPINMKMPSAKMYVKIAALILLAEALMTKSRSCETLIHSKAM